MKIKDIPGIKNIDDLIEYLKKQEMRKCLTADYLNNVDDQLCFKNREMNQTTQNAIEKIFNKLKIIQLKCEEERKRKDVGIEKVKASGDDKGK